MPRVTESWRSNPYRAEYYRQRTIKVQMELQRFRERYVSPKKFVADLGKFCQALESRITQSALPTELKSELRSDISDFIRKAKRNGQSADGQVRRRRGRRSSSKAVTTPST
jgi:hypothetical protein